MNEAQEGLGGVDARQTEKKERKKDLMEERKERQNRGKWQTNTFEAKGRSKI